MITHDVLAYAAATEAVARIRRAEEPWSTILSTRVHVTSSRNWPMPDFVVIDTEKGINIAAEFKPPDQTKREYLTGLGQALSYSNHFDYSLLIVPSISDDQFPIADYISRVLSQPELSTAPVGLISYDPKVISAESAPLSVGRFFNPRRAAPLAPATLNSSFYAKWREISPVEMGAYLNYLFDESRQASNRSGTIRDRAFERVWLDIQAGKLTHWGGGVRHAKDRNKIGWNKNYRNFLSHINWIESDGRLTEAGFKALRLASTYTPSSQPFLDFLSRCLLLEGKHLVLLHAINEYQNSHMAQSGDFENEARWLGGIETYLEDLGLLNRNRGRADAATESSPRQFLKAEKQIWRQLGFIVPYGPTGGRVYHPRRGFVFHWSRITEVIRQ